MKRGRPPIPVQSNESQVIFSRVYEDEFTIETWVFDLDKSKNSPVSVDIKYKNNFDKGWEKRQKTTKEMNRIERNSKKQKTPLTQQKWTNPTNGKLVSYQRAKQLGLI